jgi:serine/threonine protein kinase
MNLNGHFFYVRNKEAVGPLTLDELLGQNISAKTYIWIKGMENWQMIESLPFILSKFKEKKIQPQILKLNNEKDELENIISLLGDTNEPTGIISLGDTYEPTGNVSLKDTDEPTGIIQGENSRSKLHGLSLGDVIELKGEKYTINKIISEGTGEGSVYLITNKNKDKLALKLYKNFENPKDEPNPEALMRVKNIDNPDILKLHDFGVGEHKFRDKFCFEITDFAAGGDLLRISDFQNKFTLEYIEKQFIPEIFNGIKALHDKRIYHCDLKPGNIFYLDENQNDLIIGDYGSAKTFDMEFENEVGDVSTVKGTQYYTANEQLKGHVSEKNDYYSFGIILLHLLYPNEFTDGKNFRKVSLDKFQAISNRQTRNKKIINFKEEFKRVNVLIEGLTLNYYENRFGKTEVEKWLKGETLIVNYGINESNANRPVKCLGGKIIQTEIDFIDYIKSDESWYDNLFENRILSDELLRWLLDYRDAETSNLFSETHKYYVILGKNYLKEALIRFFKPETPILIDTKVFDFYNPSVNLKDEVEKFIAELDVIWKFTDIKDIRFYIFQMEFSLRKMTLSENFVANALVDKILAVFGIEHKSFANLQTEIHKKLDVKSVDMSREHLLNLFYTFNSQRSFSDYKNNYHTNIEDVGMFFIKEPSYFNDEKLKIERNIFLTKNNLIYLLSYDYNSFVFEIFKLKSDSKIDFISLSFDKYRNFSVKYKYYKSLNSFLVGNGIDVNLINISDIDLVYYQRKKVFQPFSIFAKVVLNELSLKHNIATLKKDDITNFHKHFILESIKRYLYIYSGQFLALIILLTTIYYMYLILTNNLSF